MHVPSHKPRQPPNDTVCDHDSAVPLPCHWEGDVLHSSFIFSVNIVISRDKKIVTCKRFLSNLVLYFISVRQEPDMHRGVVGVNPLTVSFLWEAGSSHCHL